VAAFWEDDGCEAEDVFWESEGEVAEEEAQEKDVDVGGDEAKGVGLAGEGRGDVEEDFADEFKWEVGPDVWGKWVCHWLGGLLSYEKKDGQGRLLVSKSESKSEIRWLAKTSANFELSESRLKAMKVVEVEKQLSYLIHATNPKLPHTTPPATPCMHVLYTLPLRNSQPLMKRSFSQFEIFFVGKSSNLI
jgi:hypothetical protein